MRPCMICVSFTAAGNDWGPGGQDQPRGMWAVGAAVVCCQNWVSASVCDAFNLNCFLVRQSRIPVQLL